MQKKEHFIHKSRSSYICFFFCTSLLFSSHLCISPSPFLNVTQIRGLYISRLLSPSLVRYVPSFLSREDFSPFLSRRLASKCVLCVYLPPVLRLVKSVGLAGINCLKNAGDSLRNIVFAPGICSDCVLFTAEWSFHPCTSNTTRVRACCVYTYRQF